MSNVSRELVAFLLLAKTCHMIREIYSFRLLSFQPFSFVVGFRLLSFQPFWFVVVSTVLVCCRFNGFRLLSFQAFACIYIYL